MSTSRNPQHRKPGTATTAKSVAIRAAAIGAVAVPGAALSAHELAGQQSETVPLQPLDDELLAQQTDHAGIAAANPLASSPSEVQATLLRINERREQAAADAETAAAHTTAATQASKKPAAATVSYTVRDGDYLSQIAENYLGNASDYQEIYALNKDRVESGGERFTDPSVIMPGWTLTLPAGAKPGHADSSSSTTSTSSATYSGSSSGSQRAYSASDVASTRSTRARSSSTSSDSSSSSSSNSSDNSSDSSDVGASGSLSTWIDEAISVLREHGYDVSYNAIYETAMHESGGNPDAVNGEDSNAAEGHPSIGLMQTIQSTFDAYALPGYDDIRNPVDNIISAARYAASVYGSLDEMVDARCGGGCWRGY